MPNANYAISNGAKRKESRWPRMGAPEPGQVGKPTFVERHLEVAAEVERLNGRCTPHSFDRGEPLKARHTFPERMNGRPTCESPPPTSAFSH